MVNFDIVSALLGLLVGLSGALGGAYLLFQPRQACKEFREDQTTYLRDLRKNDSKCLSDIKAMLTEMQLELEKQRRILMGIIVALPVDDSIKRELLKG